MWIVAVGKRSSMDSSGLQRSWVDTNGWVNVVCG